MVSILGVVLGVIALTAFLVLGGGLFRRGLEAFRGLGQSLKGAGEAAQEATKETVEAARQTTSEFFEGIGRIGPDITGLFTTQEVREKEANLEDIVQRRQQLPEFLISGPLTDEEIVKELQNELQLEEIQQTRGSKRFGEGPA